MKVKLIVSSGTGNFEEEINKFIKGRKIIDIRYQYHPNAYTAVILYEELNENAI